jgi:hypothetical protein
MEVKMKQQHVYEIPLIVHAKSDGKKSEIVLEKPESSRSIDREFTSRYLHQQDFSVGLFKLGDIGVVSIHWMCIPFMLIEFPFDPPFDRRFKLRLNAKVDGGKGEISLVALSTYNKIEYGNKITVLDSKTFSIHLGEIDDKISAVLYQQADDPLLLSIGDPGYPL